MKKVYNTPHLAEYGTIENVVLSGDPTGENLDAVRPTDPTDGSSGPENVSNDIIGPTS